MNLQNLSLPMIVVNRHNDRHGELSDEQTSINWLLQNHEQHMKNLTKDIVKQRRVFEAPLVAPLGVKYVVFDGNRRVTCLKLLLNPDQAPAKFRKFYIEERARWSGPLLSSIDCQIETDSETIDEILFRRHTGSQAGVGQSHWDDTAKDNFISRTGRRDGINLPEEIEKKLLEEGFIDHVGSLPRSNLKRLLSSEEFRNAVGLSLARGQLNFTHKPGPVLNALARIASDLNSKRLVLGDLWNNDGKRTYISELRTEGILPLTENILTNPLPFAEGKTTKQSREVKQPRGYRAPDLRRESLIPRNIDYNISWSAKTARHQAIWNELQNRLFFDRHANAISVLFRVLLEISIDHYITISSVLSAHPNDQLSNKVEKVSAHLVDARHIDEKYRKELRKFVHAEAIVSTNTMHRYVHSSTFAPSPEHLTALWDTLSRLIVCCLASETSAVAAA